MRPDVDTAVPSPIGGDGENEASPSTGPQLVRPGMMLIGATGRTCGKTLLAARLIEAKVAGAPVAAAKVTTVYRDRGPCPRGGDGCGICSSLDAPYRLLNETGEHEGKDTARLLAAGAKPVWWLCAREDHLSEAARALTKVLPDGPAICESNGLRQVVEPGLFIIVQRDDRQNIKRSCRLQWDKADAILTFDGQSHSAALDDFTFVNNRWALKRKLTAIVLAGGQSTRMGRDKALLPVAGRTMIEHIVEQLRPHFDEILISANDPDRYAFLGLEVVPDARPGLGPMAAIAASIARARHEQCFVIPCDAPTVPLGPLYRLLRRARRGSDVVVPLTPESHFEPLFAIYSRRLAPKLNRALERGERGIVKVYDECETQTLRLGVGEELRNVNTVAEYEQFLGDSS